MSEIQRAQILILHKEGLLERKICNKVSYSKMAVHQAIIKFKNSGIYTNKKQSSRPQKMTCHDDNFIWQIAVQSLTCSCKKIRSALLLKDTNVLCLTVSRRLAHDFKLKACKTAKKPHLTKVMKAKRIAFAKKYKNWDEAKWDIVLYLDESTTQQRHKI